MTCVRYVVKYLCQMLNVKYVWLINWIVKKQRKNKENTILGDSDEAHCDFFSLTFCVAEKYQKKIIIKKIDRSEKNHVQQKWKGKTNRKAEDSRFYFFVYLFGEPHEYFQQ